MRKVELPEVSEEEVEASLVVVFAAPFQRLGLAETQGRALQRRQCKRQNSVAQRGAPLCDGGIISVAAGRHCDSGRKRMLDKRAKVYLQSNSRGSISDISTAAQHFNNSYLSITLFAKIKVIFLKLRQSTIAIFRCFH